MFDSRNDSNFSQRSKENLRAGSPRQHCNRPGSVEKAPVGGNGSASTKCGAVFSRKKGTNGRTTRLAKLKIPGAPAESTMTDAPVRHLLWKTELASEADRPRDPIPKSPKIADVSRPVRNAEMVKSAEIDLIFDPFDA